MMHRILYDCILPRSLFYKYLLVVLGVGILNFIMFVGNPFGTLARASDFAKVLPLLLNFTTTTGWDQLWYEMNSTSDRILNQLRYRATERKKTILIYLPDGYASFGFENPNPFLNYANKNCFIKNCMLTDQAAKLESADAVVFQTKIKKVPLHRPVGQIWVLQTAESPSYTGRFNHVANMINYTITYRWDSDIVDPYGTVVARDVDENTPEVNYGKNKTKMVAWIVSNCHSANNRRDYARELQKYIDVGIYGKCGTMKCEQNSCFSALAKHYRFYLAFENSNCRDYVTEKYFHNGFRHNVIPVAMGAPKEFYERISPPHSFIHVDDFGNPRELAKYLHYLASNESAYNEYFEWKNKFKVLSRYGNEMMVLCRLCTILNEPKQKVYLDLDKWWRIDANC